MKNKIISILFMTAVMSSCSFLDVVPENTATLQDSFASEMQAERFLYSIYNFIPNNTTHRWTPDLCAGGDLITGPGGVSRWFPYKSMLYGEENPNNTYFNMWGGGSLAPGGNNFQLYKGIRFAYLLLNNIDSVPDMTQSAKDQMKGEAYFLIAYLHWTLMQYYGPVVLITHESSLNDDESKLMLPRSTWDECARFVAETFDKAADLLPPTWPDRLLSPPGETRYRILLSSPFRRVIFMFSVIMPVNLYCHNRSLRSWLPVPCLPSLLSCRP